MFRTLRLSGSPALRQETADYFKRNCANCHTIGGGRLTGPDLKNVKARKDREWLIRFMLNPKAVIDGGDPYAKQMLDESRGVLMPVTPDLNAERVDSILKLIELESKLERSQFVGVGSAIPDRPFTDEEIEKGRELFVGNRTFAKGGAACLSCHNVQGLTLIGGGMLGPDLTQVWGKLQGRKGLAAWLSSPPTPTMQPIYKKTPSYAGGARMLQLMGGISLSFYDWYCDLPPASPETWGEQTDVHESADWYNAKLMAVMGANLNMTRTPDCHFAAEARHNGSKMWVFSPDFNMVAKYADEWVGLNTGQDGAWWLAVNHVLLKEFHHEKQVPYFIDYTKKYTDAPYLVELVEADGTHQPGQMLRAGRLAGYESLENRDWKFLMWDAKDQRPKVPMGSSGFRWGTEKGKWNLLLKDGVDGSDIDPTLTFLNQSDEVVSIRLDDFAEGRTIQRDVPAKRLTTADGKSVLVTTVYDVLITQYGVDRRPLAPRLCKNRPGNLG